MLLTRGKVITFVSLVKNGSSVKLSLPKERVEVTEVGRC